MSSDRSSSFAQPSWAEGLSANGVYREGYTNHLDKLLEAHKSQTVTTYGTRRSRGLKTSDSADPKNSKDKENSGLTENTESSSTVKQPAVRLYWKKTEGGREVQFNDTPFQVDEERVLDCQFGKQYFKSKKPVAGKTRNLLQGTRKIGCLAHIRIKSYTLYPKFAVTAKEAKGLTQTKLRELKLNKLEMLRRGLVDGSVGPTTKRFFVSLPTEEAHSGHIVGAKGGFAQRMNPLLVHKVGELVSMGITDTAEVKRALKAYLPQVCHELNIKPAPTDRAFYPTTTDVRNHIYTAKIALQLSKLDQENLRLHVEKWQKEASSSFFFRPYIKKEEPSDKDSHFTVETTEYEQTFLVVHQEKWQQELLTKYGNTITLMDATYKTTRYDVALFFVCVRTNSGYSVVAEFITQTESAQQISEALSILKSWNPSWNPPFFMIDFSDAESAAIETAFPQTKVFICDFHREQAWERWVKDRKHGLNNQEADELLEHLRSCANAPPVMPDDQVQYPQPVAQDYLYQQALSLLKGSDGWKNNETVQNWLNTTWLCIPERWARAYRDNSYHGYVNTNNGVEAQNRLLKYSYLPKRKNLSVSSIMTLLVEDFLPDMHRKYLMQNFKMSSNYRAYKKFVPTYLQGRPPSVIMHCMERMRKSKKYAKEEVTQLEHGSGKFCIASGEKSHTIDFGATTGKPSCSCQDWVNWNIPCKHFFAVFRLFDNWSWNNLPASYLSSPFISGDHEGVQTGLDSLLGEDSPASPPSVHADDNLQDEQDSERLEATLPKKGDLLEVEQVRRNVRISLKCIESLSFNVTEPSVLQDMLGELQDLEDRYRSKLPQSEGLLLRPTVKDRAIKIKKKYQVLQKRLSQYSALPLPKKHRKKDHLRKRVGRRATKLRKEADAVKESRGSTTKPHHTDNKPSVGGKRRRGVCGTCEGCRQKDCKQCVYCLDKPKYGGPGKLKQRCRERRCRELQGTSEAKRHCTSSSGASVKETVIENNAQCSKKIDTSTQSHFLATGDSALSRIPVDQYYQGLSTGRFVCLSNTPAIEKPIPPEYHHHFLPPKSPDGYKMATQFLQRQERKIDPVMSDGNCLFRALSVQIYGKQALHTQLRSTLVNFVQLNEPRFQVLLPLNTKFDTHIAQMAKSGTWGTRLEIQAAATLLNFPVYVASQNPRTRQYYWKRYTPYPASNMIGTDTGLLPLETTQGKTHLELALVNDVHFESVMSNVMEPPSYDTVHTYVPTIFE